MKITRVLTYNIDEDYARDYFDEWWWEDKTEPDEIDYDFFIDGLRDNGYDNEEILTEQGTKEKIKQIWQEECDKYHKEHKQTKTDAVKEKILDDIQYHKDMIAQLEKQLKDA